MDYNIDGLLKLINESGRQYDKQKILFAYNSADAAHVEQIRKSGDPYINHPLAVAYILVELGMDTDIICAALLHDVVEDTGISIEQIQRNFGEGIAQLVDGVTKIKNIAVRSAETEKEQQAENVRKMLFAAIKDVRVIVIKLADRLHNMRTLSHMPTQKQRDVSFETLEIYTPLAHMLGIRRIQEELSDIALFYLDPDAYQEIDEYLKARLKGSGDFLTHKIEEIKERLGVYKLFPHIEGRVKSRYGIFCKAYMTGREFEEVYDVFAIRIITDAVIECYNILGIIHDMFTPLPGRFKDYISASKQNMYQSLHTTVLSRESIPFEIQIRTQEMHHTAEYGIAAHWKYKQSDVLEKDKFDELLTMLRQNMENQLENNDTDELVRSIKTDIGSEEVFVYTPNGDIVRLPVESVVIDFAYAIHSEVGNKMIGAKINDRIVSLDSTVKTGDVVEIMTTKNPNHMPNRDWLKLVKTSEARNKIRACFKKERREENISQGKSELENEFKRNMINYTPEETKTVIAALAKSQKHENIDDFYAAIGYGDILLSKLMNKVKNDYSKHIDKTDKTVISPESLVDDSRNKERKGTVKIDGIEDCLIKFSRCCNPLPGDEIIGFITRGHGVSVHKSDCVNMKAARKNPDQADRLIEVLWPKNIQLPYRSTLDITARESKTLIADISTAISAFKVPMYEFSVRSLKNGNSSITAVLGITNIKQLYTIIQKLSKRPDVISVERAMK
ncbi:MAG: bifunctional (p)ppGpp synthetase/guanosine-3',5'-bis(diphosphate) 3'-pyrophosphohydrolase [Oscillospiraceae bacterium]|nr:bifunctional (p)ppGpp synthetase/guanosine-3',5'-bis(diphosphate) 3'-pyrophosphohydrolase [Oscillospiraceae bacterium]